MAIRDPHRFSHELDEDVTSRIINRLESRAKDVVFSRLFHQYADRLAFSDNTVTLEVGCGTGVVSRELARKDHFAGTIVALDQSPSFIEAARGFADDEGVGDSISFDICDAHGLNVEDASFDQAIAHTLVSHVTDPAHVIHELARVVRTDGRVVIFDGDYASLTYAIADSDLGRRMDHALAVASFNNPQVMRQLVHLLPQAGFEILETRADVVSEIGEASYFDSFLQTYAPLVVSSGLMQQEELDTWLAMVEAEKAGHTFFAACNYYTYVARRLA